MKFKKYISLLLAIVFVISGFSLPMTTNAASQGKNPVIDGYYADPDIDWFDCRFWIYPTTDGTIDYADPDGWWGAKTFKAFSSENMVDWKDEGVILDVAADTAEEAGLNENGVQIAYSPWSSSHAWAPSIEKVGNMYYFYYVAEIKEEEEYLQKYAVKNVDGKWGDIKAIGVAYANSPTGPFTALEEPLLYPRLLKEKYITDGDIPSVIDPSIFIDDDGSKYMTFGNSVPCIIELDDDMIHLKEDGKFHNYKSSFNNNGDNFMESLVVFKVDDTYVFTYSVNGTNSEDYKVNCVTSKDLFNVNKYETYNMLQKDVSKSIYGSAHQSILYYPNNDTYYISYGRIKANPDGSFPENADRGNFREVCIDKINIEYNRFTGYKFSVVPTNTGVESVSSHKLSTSTAITPATFSADGKKVTKSSCDECGKAITSSTATIKKLSSATLSSTKYTYDGKAKKPAIIIKNSAGTKLSASNYTVKYSNNTNVGTAKATITLKGNYKGTKTLSYKINPAGTSISSLTAASKGFRLTWKKQAKQTTGYQIRYSTSSKMTNAKTKTISKNSTTSTSISKLKAKKKYYVQIRTYKTVGSTKYYSNWSSAKAITTKK